MFASERCATPSKVKCNTQQETALVETTYTVVWSPQMQAMHEKSQQRQPNELEAQPAGRKHLGPYPRRHPTADDAQAAKIRQDWQRQNQPVHTSGLPRGEPVKT